MSFARFPWSGDQGHRVKDSCFAKRLVIPAKAGIQGRKAPDSVALGPRFRGGDERF